VISRAGVEHCIIDAHTMSHWLAGQAKPMLHELKKKLAVEKVMQAAQQEFNRCLAIKWRWRSTLAAVGCALQKAYAVPSNLVKSWEKSNES